MLAVWGLAPTGWSAHFAPWESCEVGGTHPDEALWRHPESFRDHLRVDGVFPRSHVGLPEGIFYEQINIVERESEDHECPRGLSDGSALKFDNAKDHASTT